MHHVELAWALARAADQCVDPGERSDIYVALGAGDTDAAIAELIRVAAREQLEIFADILASLAAWRSAQAPEVREDLGAVIDNLKVRRGDQPAAQQRLTAARRHRPLGRKNPTSG